MANLLQHQSKLPHDKLKSKLSSITDFTFKGRLTKLLSDYLIMMQHTGGKDKKGLRFSKTSLKTVINYLKEKCYFHFGNVTIK